MDFKTYSDAAYQHLFFPEEKALTIFPLGLCGEAGEVAEKFKKMHRDQGGVMDDTFKQSVKKELGDILWYINAIAKQLDFELEDVAAANLAKINSRAARGVQQGSGDDR